MKSVPDWLRVGMNISMLGYIHSDIRLITVTYDSNARFLTVRNYLARNVCQEDYEDMDVLITELWSMVGEYFDDASFECIYSLHSKEELNLLEGAVFRRKE